MAHYVSSSDDPSLTSCPHRNGSTARQRHGDPSPNRLRPAKPVPGARSWVPAEHEDRAWILQVGRGCAIGVANPPLVVGGDEDGLAVRADRGVTVAVLVLPQARDSADDAGVGELQLVDGTVLERG